ncbi:MAG TPA: hypothetical protein VHM19_18735 [Polyangiales bacterium]|nr:hypothetical protein [Polyangiales bacterium]
MSTVADGVQRRRGEWLHALWQKYGLIVVGNLVFFALLYFVQYRPNSRDNRATELLTLAQREEAEGRLEAAETLYGKILSDYDSSSAFALAKERLPKVKALAKAKREQQPPLPAACAPTIDVQDLLEQKASFYLAELVAGHYPEVQPPERERYFAALDDYVWLALNRDHVSLRKLREDPVFRAGELQRRYFTITSSARFASDWIYDDFKLKNTSFFALHNAVIELTAQQGDRSEHESIRVGELLPQAETDVLEFRVSKDGGAVTVSGTITSDEGKGVVQQRL